MPVEGDGYCSFQGTDFARVTGINCVSTIVNGSRKIIYRIDYAVTEVSMMPNKPSP